jgi:hypothetical protein
MLMFAQYICSIFFCGIFDSEDKYKGGGGTWKQKLFKITNEPSSFFHSFSDRRGGREGLLPPPPHIYPQALGGGGGKEGKG